MVNRDAVWLEVALNGAAGRAWQPGIPIVEQTIIEEAVACVRAGAAIVHLHAYDESGNPTEDVATYARIIEGIKRHCDAIVYPTLGLTGSVEQRYAPIIELAALGLMEWGVVDPGSVNIAHEFQVAAGLDGMLYRNPDSHIRAGLELAADNNWRPAYAIYEPGFVRLGAAIAANYAGLKSPIYRLMFSDHLLFGMPPSEYALEFYAKHLADTAPNSPWMISGLDADIEPILLLAIERGAHIRVGLEDAPLGTSKTNLELVEQAVSRIVSAGYAVAEVDEIRAA